MKNPFLLVSEESNNLDCSIGLIDDEIFQLNKKKAQYQSRRNELSQKCTHVKDTGSVTIVHYSYDSGAQENIYQCTICGTEDTYKHLMNQAAERERKLHVTASTSCIDKKES